MAYDPGRHHRRSIRLRDYDYTQDGAYYVTVCTHGRECLFGDIDGAGAMRRNEYGEIVLACWEAIPEHFPQADVDAFVVMPNHVHGIVIIDQDGRADGGRGAGWCEGMTQGEGMACHAPTKGPAPADARASLSDDLPQRRFAQPIAGSLATLLGAFKGAASRRINASRGTPGWTVWHRNYHERIIRNQDMLEKARRYIENNPARWAEDVNHPANATKL